MHLTLLIKVYFKKNKTFITSIQKTKNNSFWNEKYL